MAAPASRHAPTATALLVQRLAIALFLGVWTSLKFFRPEWFGNVYRPFVDPTAYGLDWATCVAAADLHARQIAAGREPTTKV